MATPLRFTFTGVLTPLLFRFLECLGLAAFYVAFCFIMLTLAAISARYLAAEMVLVLHLMSIFCFLRALQLEQASTSPITLGGVAGSNLIVRIMTVGKIRGPCTIGGGDLLQMFQLRTAAFPALEWG